MSSDEEADYFEYEDEFEDDAMDNGELRGPSVPRRDRNVEECEIAQTAVGSEACRYALYSVPNACPASGHC